MYLPLKYPNFLIIGAMKAGTTSLHNFLGGHPEIFTSRSMKEPNLFLSMDQCDRYNPFLDEFTPRYYRYGGKTDEELLQRMLQDYSGQKMIGESSTEYTKHPFHGSQTPAIIKRNNRSMKFIYILRNPVERIVSHYLYMNQRFRMTVGDRMPVPSVNGFNEVLSRNLMRFLSPSLYAMQLERYLEHFDPSQFKVLLFEEMSLNVEATLQDIFRFLGVNEQPQLDMAFDTVYNRSQHRLERPFSTPIFHEVVRLLEPDLHRLRSRYNRRWELWDLTESKWTKEEVSISV